MVKVKVIHRNPADYVQQKPGQLQRTFRNRDPRLHPFAREREYVRALTATKLQKMFAKPLVFCMEGHRDGVKSMARARTQVASFWTGSCNGEICEWNIAASKKCVKVFAAHEGFVRGLTVSPKDRVLLSGGDDKKIRMWKLEPAVNLSSLDVALLQLQNSAAAAGGADENDSDYDLEQLPQAMPSLMSQTPINVYTAGSVITSLDYHHTQPLFAVSGKKMEIWEEQRSMPLHAFQWGCDVVHCARFNPAEPSLIAATGADNSIGLYDLRGSTPIRKVLMKMRSNAVSWNPRNPPKFTAACEDQTLYTFDMRKLSSPLVVHKDFVNAVVDVDYSPTGVEFTAASFDGTVRLFNVDEGRSRDVFHSKRMQSVLCCKYSGDGRFVVSGSADMCVRVWKADAAAPLGPRTSRERTALAYRKKLVEKFGHVKEVRRIARHQHVPKLIKSTQEKKRTSEMAKKRREENLRKHRKPGSVPIIPAKKKAIYEELE